MCLDNILLLGEDRLMESEKPYIVVGSGIAGLLSAHLFSELGKRVIGFEKSERLGGSFVVGHQRLYEKGSVEIFQIQLPELQWDFIDEESVERKKGEWRNIEKEFSTEENYYLRSGFYSPRISYADILAELSKENGRWFRLRTHIVELEPACRRLLCSDGVELEYEKAVWCSSLQSLRRVWKGASASVSKLAKETRRSEGGINLDMALTRPLFSYKNTVIFSFRYKDKKCSALGIHSPQIGQHVERILHWKLILEPEIAEDREEIAKCVRALKRELFKEFPELKELIKNERLIYFSSSDTRPAAVVPSLELFPDLIYVGSDVRLPNTKEELRSRDRELDNGNFFMELVKTIA